MFYYTPVNNYQLNNQFLLYLITNTDSFSIFQNTQSNNSNIHSTHSRLVDCSRQSKHILQDQQIFDSLGKEGSGRIQERSDLEKMNPVLVKKRREVNKKGEKKRKQEIELDFRTEWKNENRNIVPNLVNQIMSFLLKRNKSQKLIEKLLNFFPHSQDWTLHKFYLYMRKIKDSTCHYLDQSTLQYFYQIHQPQCIIYEAQEQQFYMKLCRISIITFLRNDVIMVTLTSPRMNYSKRKNHLIARQALLKKFIELGRSQHF